MKRKPTKMEMQGVAIGFAGMGLLVYSAGWLATLAVVIMIWGNNAELLGRGVIGRNRG